MRSIYLACASGQLDGSQQHQLWLNAGWTSWQMIHKGFMGGTVKSKRTCCKNRTLIAGFTGFIRLPCASWNHFPLPHGVLGIATVAALAGTSCAFEIGLWLLMLAAYLLHTHIQICIYIYIHIRYLMHIVFLWCSCLPSAIFSQQTRISLWVCPGA